MNRDDFTAAPDPDGGGAPALPRLFLREPGWRIGRKVGSEREFCYVIAPGQDTYHRLADGEIYVFRDDEKVCIPCAGRRGLLVYEPRALREPIRALDRDAGEVEGGPGFDLKPPGTPPAR